MLFWSWEDQAEYVDVVTKKHVDLLDKEFLKNQFDFEEVPDIQFHQVNATSIGNLAYVILHAPKKYAEKAQLILDHVIKSIPKQ